MARVQGGSRRDHGRDESVTSTPVDYRRLLHSVDDVIVWEGDPITFRFTFVSEQAERFHEEGRRFLGESLLGSVETVDQSDVPWYDRRSSLGAADRRGGVS